MRFCTGCGAEVKEDAKFCPKCGKSLKPVSEKKVAPVREPEKKEEPLTPRDIAKGIVKETKPVQEEPEKKPFNPLAVIIPVGSVIIAALIALILIVGIPVLKDLQALKEGVNVTMESTEETSIETTSEVVTFEAETSKETVPETVLEETTEEVVEETETETEEPEGEQIVLSSGDHVFFGTYEQDNDLTNGKEPIEWIVYNDSNAYYLISAFCLDNMSFSGDPGCTSFSDSSIRIYLNEYFKNEAFTFEQQEALCEIHSVDEDSESTDLVILAGQKEIEEYVVLQENLVATNTAYAEQRMFDAMIVSEFYPNDLEEVREMAKEWDESAGVTNCSWWWLRSYAGYRVSSTGGIGPEGNLDHPSVDSLNSVRPVIVIDKDLCQKFISVEGN